MLTDPALGGERETAALWADSMRNSRAADAPPEHRRLQVSPQKNALGREKLEPGSGRYREIPSPCVPQSQECPLFLFLSPWEVIFWAECSVWIG